MLEYRWIACAVIVCVAGCGRVAFDSMRADAIDADLRGWWDAAWSHRTKLTFKNPGSAVEGLPVLVRLDETRIDYTTLQSNGQDLRFVDADGAPLPYEIESWRVNGRSTVWVRVPQIEAGTDHIWLYHGNPGVSPAEDPSALWVDSGLVWHLGDDPTVKILDSSPAANHGMASAGMPATAQNPGIIGGSLGFDGVDDWITAPHSPSLALTANLTIQMWIRVELQRAQWLADFVFPVSESEQNNHLYELSIDSGDRLELRWEYGAGLDEITESSTALANPLNAWTLITAVRDAAANVVFYYENAQPLGGTQAYANGATGGSLSTFWLGGEPDTSSTLEPLDGRIDEVRISGVVRAPSYITLDYLSMTDQLIEYGAKESY